MHRRCSLQTNTRVILSLSLARARARSLSISVYLRTARQRIAEAKHSAHYTTAQDSAVPYSQLAPVAGAVATILHFPSADLEVARQRQNEYDRGGGE
jgi:hypothetical protein